MDGFVYCWRDTGGHFLKKIILELLLKQGGDFIYINFNTGKLGAANPST